MSKTPSMGISVYQLPNTDVQIAFEMPMWKFSVLMKREVAQQLAFLIEKNASPIIKPNSPQKPQ